MSNASTLFSLQLRNNFFSRVFMFVEMFGVMPENVYLQGNAMS